MQNNQPTFLSPVLLLTTYFLLIDQAFSIVLYMYREVSAQANYGVSSKASSHSCLPCHQIARKHFSRRCKCKIANISRSDKSVFPDFSTCFPPFRRYDIAIFLKCLNESSSLERSS